MMVITFCFVLICFIASWMYIDLKSENEMNYQVDDLLKVDSKRDINGHRLV